MVGRRKPLSTLSFTDGTKATLERKISGFLPTHYDRKFDELNMSTGLSSNLALGFAKSLSSVMPVGISILICGRLKVLKIRPSGYTEMMEVRNYGLIRKYKLKGSLTLT